MRFTVGTRGASAAHIAYLSRPAAVAERGELGGICGFFSQGLPDDVLKAETYDELRQNLILYASMREEAEPRGRTHYRALFSFENQIPGDDAREMVREWVEAAFFGVRAIGFVHQDTAHTHFHLWMDARKPDARKIHLAPREYRTLDEKWNKIYCRAMGRDEREYLGKKRSLSHERRNEKAAAKREHIGASNRALREGPCTQTEVSAPAERGVQSTACRERAPPSRKRTVASAISAHDKAIREVDGLHRDITQVARDTNRDREICRSDGK